MRVPKFCSACGECGLEPGDEQSSFKCRQCGTRHYLNSKPSVCALIVQNRSVLLVRTSRTAHWDTPGGFLLHGEDPKEGLRRELFEELTIEVQVGRLVAARVDVYGEDGEYSLNLFYETQLATDTLKPANEVVEFEWFRMDQLPKLKYRSTAQQLTELRTDFGY